MLAHFVGGPMHGTDRVVEDDKFRIEAYRPVQQFDWLGREDYPKLNQIEIIAGEYVRIAGWRQFGQAGLPAIYVWLDESESVRS